MDSLQRCAEAVGVSPSISVEVDMRNVEQEPILEIHQETVSAIASAVESGKLGHIMPLGAL